MLFPLVSGSPGFQCDSEAGADHTTSPCGRLHSCMQAEPKRMRHHVNQVTAMQRFGACCRSLDDGFRDFREQM